MGGHGGLNILPQKRWNVYNYENREKVRKDEEAAAREDQLRREQSRRRDAEFRLERLRQARRLANPSAASAPSDSHHINLFDAIPEFASEPDRKPKKNEDNHKDSKKRKREEPRVVPPEDEKYKLGYGLVGKGVKAPWYVSGSSLFSPEGGDEDRGSSGGVEGSAKKSGGKKTIEEMREERMKREKQEKKRESRLLASAGKKEVKKGYSRRNF